MKNISLYLLAFTAAFVALDVTGKISWSWWQVTLPLFIGVAIGVFLALANAPRKK